MTSTCHCPTHRANPCGSTLWHYYCMACMYMDKNISVLVSRNVHPEAIDEFETAAEHVTNDMFCRDHAIFQHTRPSGLSHSFTTTSPALGKFFGDMSVDLGDIV
jgi:hypothetical protein